MMPPATLRKMNPVAAEVGYITSRPVGFIQSLVAMANRAIRILPRDIAFILPALIVPIFFYAVTLGALQDLAGNFPGLELDYKAFQLPVALVTTVTGLSRAAVVVTDVKGGYFDRLLLTPLSRYSVLLGQMVADLIVFIGLCVPVVALGFIVGVRFETGAVGVLVFIGMSALWGLMYAGFPYAMALATGNPTAVNNTFLLFFPFVFLTTAWVPKESLSGWLSSVATYNPVTYILDGLRSLISGWDGAALGKALAAIVGVGLVAQFLAFLSLKRRSNFKITRKAVTTSPSSF